MMATHLTDTAVKESTDTAVKESTDTALTVESNSLSPMVRILCSELIEHASVLQSF